MPTDNQHYTTKIIQSVSVMPPASRLMGVLVCINPDGTSSKDHYPVVALKLSLVDHYEFNGNARRPESPNHTEMIRNGWRFNRREDTIEMMINDESGGVGEINQILGALSHGAYTVVDCPWPEDQDDILLAGIEVHLETRAREKISRHSQQTEMPEQMSRE